MIKRWIGRVLALAVIVGIIITTRTYFNNTVLPYAVAAQEQREKWDAQRAEIQQKQEEKEKQVSESENSETVTSSDNNESEDLTVSIFEPSEATGDDFYLNLGHFDLWESGEFDKDTGEKKDNKRRLRYPQLVEIECPEYQIKLSDGFSFVIVEYKDDNSFIRSEIVSSGEEYRATKDAAYFSITLFRKENEKSLSLGQWSNIMSDEAFEAVICTEMWLDMARSATGSLISGTEINVDAKDMSEMLMNGKDDELAYVLWNKHIETGIYSLNYEDLDESRITYFVSSSEGDDNNSGLSIDKPKKSLAIFSGMSGVNILLKCGDTFNISEEFKAGSDSLYAAYGEGERPVISFYRDLNVTFYKTDRYDNLWVADLSNLDICNNSGTKDNCNIGQLLVNGKVNWNRVVWSSKEEFDTSWVVANDDDAWAVDWNESKLYYCCNEDPNRQIIKFAPNENAFTLKKLSDVEIKGLKIIGAGRHGCNITNCQNIIVSDCYFSYIGGSVLRQAGVRFGNAIQVWDSGKKIDISNNYCAWIFDTCFTNQGTDSEAEEENIHFVNNIGTHFFWGIETWGDGYSVNGFKDILYAGNILYDNIDVTNPYTKMHSGTNTRLLDTKDSEYISYRNGYKYHQMSSINVSNSGTGEVVRIENNILWNSNRFLVLATNDRSENDFSALKNNIFVANVDSLEACLLRYTLNGNKQYCKEYSALGKTNQWNIYKGKQSAENAVSTLIVRLDDIATSLKKSKTMHDVPKKGVVFGNSITLGFGTHGMASSDIDTDYYYIVDQYIKSKNPNYEMKRIAGNDWENGTDSDKRSEIFSNEFEAYLDSEVDIVIIQLGDNVSSEGELESFQVDCELLLKKISDKAPNARIIWVFGRYHLKNKGIIENACNLYGAEFVDVSIISTDSKYMANIGDIYIDKNGNMKEIEKEGVASHPNDLGMRTIAELIIETLNY